MPDIVKICFAQLKKMSGDHPINLIDQNSFIKYRMLGNEMKWDSSIDTHINNTSIDLTKLSDFIRSYILYNFGGVWIDATVFLTQTIDSIIGDRPFYTARHDPGENYNEFCVEGRWTGFFIGCTPNFALMKHIFNNMLNVLNRDHSFKEYFTIDYLFMNAYNNNTWIRTMISQLPIINQSFTRLPLNDEFDEITWSEYLDNAPFYKLSWKQKFDNKLPNGNKTIYGHLNLLYRNSLNNL